MKKVSYLFMQSNIIEEKKTVKINKEGKEEKKQTVEKEEVKVDSDLQDLFNIDFNNEPDEEIIDDNLFNTDFYDAKEESVDKAEQYDISNELIVDNEYKVSRKEALTSIESKTPFVVGKIESKKACIEENDIVYKVDPKISFKENRQARVVGYLFADNKIKHKKVNMDKVAGMLGYDFPVYKKNGFNRSSVGYIKLAKDHDNYDKYIRVTKSNGFSGIFMIFIMILLAVMLSKLQLPEGWNMDNMTLYKTEQQLIQNNIDISLSHDSKMIIDEHGTSFDISVDGDDDLEVEFQILMNDEVIGKSNIITVEQVNRMKDVVYIYNNFDKGEYNCKLLCKVLDAGKYVGELESDFVLVIK